MSLKSRFVALLLASVVGFVWGPSVAMGATTVVVVRHAEKVIEAGNRDPALTEAGIERAEALARLLRDVPIAAVYSSDYERTRRTAKPTAASVGVEVEVRDPRDPEGLRDEILKEHGGEAVLVVGHSNTVPWMLAALGVENPPAIDESEYDNCFIVRVSEEGEAELLRLHFGAETAEIQSD